MRVTSKGQVTIPKEIRDALGIGSGSSVDFVWVDDTVVLRKVEGGPGRGQTITERLRGSADVGMTTDEILALTRDG